jgi:hypothetical protein
MENENQKSKMTEKEALQRIAAELFVLRIMDLRSDLTKASFEFTKMLNEVFGTESILLTAIETMAFFVHVFDRVSFRSHNDEVGKILYHPIASSIPGIFSEVVAETFNDIPGFKSVEDLRDHMKWKINERGEEYAKLNWLNGAGSDSSKSLFWCASANLAETVGRPKNAIAVVTIQTMLTEFLLNLELENRILQLERDLSPDIIPILLGPIK